MGTINGIGTHLSGERQLTREEFDEWKFNFPFIENAVFENYRIATESLVFLYIPIIPFKTLVYYNVSDGILEKEYIPLFKPNGDKIYWKHVEDSFTFYLFPLIVACYLVYRFVGGLVV